MLKILKLCIPIILLLTTYCHSPKSNSKITPLNVDVAEVITDTVPNRMEFVGKISENTSVTIQPRVNGYIKSIHYVDNMPVKRGQLLFTIDPAEFNADLTAAQASLSSAAAMLDQAENDYKRAIPLAGINAISQSMLDQYKSRYLSAEANRNVAMAQLHNTKLKLSYTKIYAPIDGIISKSDAFVGDYVGAGSKYTILNTISNVDSVQVGVSIPMAEYLTIIKRITPPPSSYANEKLLSNIDMVLSDGSPYQHKGSYKYTGRDITASTGVITLYAIFPNPNKLLKVGEYTKIRTNVGPIKRVNLVPQRSVSQSQGINSLWIITSDGKAEYRAVELGDTYGNMRIIEKGVEQGEHVLVSGQQKVKQGMELVVNTTTKH